MRSYRPDNLLIQHSLSKLLNILLFKKSKLRIAKTFNYPGHTIYHCTNFQNLRKEVEFWLHSSGPRVYRVQLRSDLPERGRESGITGTTNN